MISTSEWRAEHPFAGWNTQQVIVEEDQINTSVCSPGAFIWQAKFLRPRTPHPNTDKHRIQGLAHIDGSWAVPVCAFV